MKRLRPAQGAPDLGRHLNSGPKSHSETASVHAYNHLRQELMLGTFRPGQKITVAAIAETLALSPTPVRLALRQLLSVGGLEESPNRSIRVPENSLREIVQARRLRAMLEGEAAAQAALIVDREQVAELEQLQDVISTARDRRDLRSALELNLKFHFQIYRQSANPVLVDTIESLWLRTGPSISLLPPAVQNNLLFAATDPHPSILQALLRRDAEAARHAVMYDVQDIIEYFEDILPASPVAIINDGSLIG